MAPPAAKGADPDGRPGPGREERASWIPVEVDDPVVVRAAEREKEAPGRRKEPARVGWEPVDGSDRGVPDRRVGGPLLRQIVDRRVGKAGAKRVEEREGKDDVPDLAEPRDEDAPRLGDGGRLERRGVHARSTSRSRRRRSLVACSLGSPTIAVRTPSD